MPASRLPALNSPDFTRLAPLFLKYQKILSKKRYPEVYSYPHRRTKQF